ncbi:MAG: 3-oxoacyl-ACP reductase FabG [Acidimicrobiales bacterium]
MTDRQPAPATPRVAFVTGGTRGIGLAVARRLASQGHRVAIGSRTEPDHTDDDLLWVPLDIADQGSVDAAYATVTERLGSPGIVVANAGITRDTLVLRMSEDDFTTVVDVNLNGAFRTAKAALRPMMKARWGRIVFISSVVAGLGQVGQANYSAAKSGLGGLARSLAREYASRGITVNLVAPGPIDTDMLAEIGDDGVAAMVEQVPVGRVGTADEVAGAVAYLCSEDAAYVTGVTLGVDGGLGMRP